MTINEIWEGVQWAKEIQSFAEQTKLTKKQTLMLVCKIADLRLDAYSEGYQDGRQEILNSYYPE